jgi:23S rRNA pseudouridine1911/1915/1917 synthase
MDATQLKFSTPRTTVDQRKGRETHLAPGDYNRRQHARRLTSIMPSGFDILYEDAGCLVAAKPAGLLTQAPLGIDSLEYRVKRFLKERDGQPGDVYLGVPHRLDRPVSGAIVFAKTLKAAQRISKQFERRRVEKTYWALVAGDVTPVEGTWTDCLKKIEGQPRSFVVGGDDPAGRVAVMHYKLAGTFQVPSADQVAGTLRLPSPENGTRSVPATLLEITLETGRMHQIRVQCASRGHPLLGDELYGSQVPFGPWSDDERERLIALHARGLKFWHHEAGGHIAVVAPLPGYWKEVGVSTEKT